MFCSCFFLVCCIFWYGKKIVSQWLIITLNVRVRKTGQDEFRERIGGKTVSFESHLETNYTDFVDIIDLAEESSGEVKKTINVEDDYGIEFRVELPEETEDSFKYHSYFLSTDSDQNTYHSKLDIPSDSEPQQVKQIDKCLDVYELESNYWSEYFENYPCYMRNGNFCSLTEENTYDSLHVSNKVTWSNSPYLTDGDYIDVMVNEIVCYYANTTQQPENDSENSEKSKGIEATVCKTTKSQKASVFLECTEEFEVEKDKPKKRHRLGRRKRTKRKIQKLLRDIINWQTSLRRNPTVLYDVLPGTTEGRTAFNQMAQSGSNEKNGDSREVVNGFLPEAQPQNAGEINSNNKRDKWHASEVQDSLQLCLGHQNGIINNKYANATDEMSRDKKASFSSPLHSAITLLSEGEEKAFYLEWIRLKTFSEWPLTSIFSTSLARNGWVSLGEGDRARCYSCHVVHEGWKIGDDPDQFHSPNCR